MYQKYYSTVSFDTIYTFFSHYTHVSCNFPTSLITIESSHNDERWNKVKLLSRAIENSVSTETNRNE